MSRPDGNVYVVRRIMPRLLAVVASVGVLLTVSTPSAAAGVHRATRVSGPSPFEHCKPGKIDSTLPEGAFEPLTAVNPTNPANIVTVWAQDRFHGLVAGVSFDGGASWRRVVIPGFTRCTGGRFDYVDDSWLSFSPDGTLHLYGKVFDGSSPRSGALVSRSTDGGLTWSPPVRLLVETDPGEGNYSGGAIATDPADSDRIYVVVPKFFQPGWRRGLVRW